MVSPSKTQQQSRVASSQQQSHNKCKLIKGLKPLINHKFYLDIEKHHICSKIETKIKELGGSINFFLAKEVTHFVTDKPIEQTTLSLNDLRRGSPSPLLLHTPKTPQTPYTPGGGAFLLSNEIADSPNVSNNSNESKASSSKHQSRADAMLQRARTQQSTTISPTYDHNASRHSKNISQSPVQLAKSWGTPIWTPEYTLKFLDKVSAALKFDLNNSSRHHHHHSKVRLANVKHLKGDYIKIESFQKQYRPYYQELKNWPTIHLNSRPGYCPFELTVGDELKNRKKDNNLKKADSKSSSKRMTRKSRSKTQVRTTTTTTTATTKNTEYKRTSEKQCGYCEICRLEYDVLTQHLQSKEHVNFVKNSDNFLTLDTLIQNSANVESFLKKNQQQNTTTSDDIDNGIFGKRTTAGRRMCHQKLIKSVCDDDLEIKQDVSDEDEDDDEDDVEEDDDVEKINGLDKKRSSKIMQNNSSPHMTRRSNYRKTTEPSDTKKSTKQTRTKDEVDAEEEEPEEDEVADDGNEAIRSRRESAKRINYAEPREDEENADDCKSKIDKIRLRGIRWRPPSSSDNNRPQSSMSQPIVYKVVDDKSKSTGKSSNSRKEPLCEQNKDSSNSLKVRICRVRESELSRLTDEADNFMFPRSASELLTDDDRDSSSSEANADVSTDLVSSASDKLAPPPPVTTSSTRSRNYSTSSFKDLNATNKRQRRNQLEAFLIDNSDYYKFDKPDSRLRFQEAPFQPSLIQQHTVTNEAAKKTTTATTTLLSNRKFGSAGSSTIASDSGADKIRATEDRMGAFTYHKGKILQSDIVKKYKFAFERIPSSEPWYGAFQRQDECRERVFEYWGSTAYRKLPYELGALPPLSMDCCALSRYLAIKKANEKLKPNTKRRGKKGSRLVPSSQSDPPTTVDCTNEDINPKYFLKNIMNNERRSSSAATPPPPATATKPPKKCRELINLEQDIIHPAQINKLMYSRSATTITNNLTTFSSTIETRGGGGDVTRPVVKIKATPKPSPASATPPHKRNLLKDFQINSLTAGMTTTTTSSRGSSIKSAISESKKSILLDLNEQPRKSPREHASTLAILSHLVQQRKKIAKDLNGGISPDKMPNKDESDYEEDGQSTDIGDGGSTPAIDDEDDDDEEFHEALSHHEHSNDDSCMEPDVKPVAISETDDTKLDDQKTTTAASNDNKCTRKMSAEIYVDPKRVCRDIDELLTNSFVDAVALEEFQYLRKTEDLDQPVDDLILLNTPKDFVEIVNSVQEGPLRYSSLVNLRKRTGLSSFSQKGRKRRNNKTGWPTLPKKRIFSKRECDETGAEIENGSDRVTTRHNNYQRSIETNSDNAAADRLATGTAVDISDRLENDEFFIRSRQKLNSLGEDCSKDDDYSNDGNNSLVFTSSSEKAENSDIFTVSSDSLDTDHLIDLNSKTAATTAAAGGKEFSDDVLGNLVNNSDESSADITLAEMLKKQIGVQRPVVVTNGVGGGGGGVGGAGGIGVNLHKKSINNKYKLLNRSRRLKGKTIMKIGQKKSANSSKIGASRVAIKQLTLLQPIISVQKVFDNSMNHQRMSTPPPSSSSSAAVAAAAATTTATTNHLNCINNKKSPSLAANSRNQQCPPNKMKFSPRKLRKPRGRWYRER